MGVFIEAVRILHFTLAESFEGENKNTEWKNAVDNEITLWSVLFLAIHKILMNNKLKICFNHESFLFQNWNLSSRFGFASAW